ncbi:hypothetical protein ACWU4D_13965 [Vibrio sp. WJH972]
MITDKFYNLYNSSFRIKSITLAKAFRFTLFILSNVFIPVVFFFRKNKYSLYVNNTEEKKSDIILSLTSFPARIDRAHLVIESLMRQTVSPSRIILWLSKEQFSSELELPKNLLELKKRGLEIYIRSGDLRSYKKYYYVLKEIEGKPFIIVDDDIFYPSDLVESLLKTHRKYPNDICANRCAVINQNQSYESWDMIKSKNSESRSDLLPTGCGGVLYPVGSLHEYAIRYDLFMNAGRDADDIWLNCCAILNSRKIAYTGKFQFYLNIYNRNNSNLYTKNLGAHQNDKRISDISKLIKSEFNINIFER